MAELIKLPTFKDDRGFLSVADSLPFEVKRVYWMYHTREPRGGHAHRVTRQALISIQGSVVVNIHYPENNVMEYVLNNPNKMLILNPEDWHSMTNFSYHNILLVLASELYDKEDYVY